MWAESRVTGRIPRAVAEMCSSGRRYFLAVHGDSMDRLSLTTGTLVTIQAPTGSEGQEQRENSK